MNPQPEEKRKTPEPGERIAIVGGGMLGIALAWRLVQQNPDLQLTLYEARDRLGGLADAWQLGDIAWDRHYHVISMADMRLRKILEEVELDVEFVETKTGFYSQERYYSLSNAIQFLQFKPLNLYEKFRLGSTIFFGSKIRNWRRLEQIPVVEWLERWSGKSTTRKIWIPLLKSKLGDSYRDASAAFIWAYIDRMYKARQTGLKKEMFGYVPGGYRAILDRFAQCLGEAGVRIELNQPVQRVEQTADGRFSLQTPERTEAGYDRVLVTTPTPIVAQMCPQLTDEEKQKFASIDYLGIVCASVLLKQPLEGYYVTNILDPTPITAIIEMSAIVDPQQLGGRHLVYLPKYCTPEDPVTQMSDGQVEELFTETLLKMHPKLSPDDIEAFRISRVKYVMAMPTMNYSQHLPPIRTSLPGLYTVNSSHILGGILNVDETIGIAEQSLAMVTEPLARPATGRIDSRPLPERSQELTTR